MSSADKLNETIERVVREHTRYADPEDADCTWTAAFHTEGAVFDLILRELPKGMGRDLVEAVLALVDWERVVERTTWRLDPDNDPWKAVITGE